MTDGMAMPLLSVENLRKTFRVKKGFPKSVTTTVRAVDGVSFDVRPGEAFGLVGESGCGKSTVGRSLLRLVEPDSGTVRFSGLDIGAATDRELRRLRRRIQIVFQDPYSSLNPRLTVGNTIAEPMLVHGLADRGSVTDKVVDLLREVGLPPEARLRYPHEFSGGQRQRIGIARALSVEPELIVADEPVSALDVSIQAQILILLQELKDRRGLSFVFISHDLAVVRYFCQRLAVMYLGRIVEEGPIPEIFETPLHPYTQLLKSTSPVPDPGAKVTFARMEGEIASAANPPKGCHFHPRCPAAMDVCRTTAPPLIQHGPGRKVACHLYPTEAASPEPASSASLSPPAPVPSATRSDHP
ncbi:MAG: ABC transporter ATP-binding protein [Azospirillaceae bacterium]